MTTRIKTLSNVGLSLLLAAVATVALQAGLRLFNVQSPWLIDALIFAAITVSFTAAILAWRIVRVKDQELARVQDINQRLREDCIQLQCDLATQCHPPQAEGSVPAELERVLEGFDLTPPAPAETTPAPAETVSSAPVDGDQEQPEIRLTLVDCLPEAEDVAEPMAASIEGEPTADAVATPPVATLPVERARQWHNAMQGNVRPSSNLSNEDFSSFEAQRQALQSLCQQAMNGEVVPFEPTQKRWAAYRRGVLEANRLANAAAA